VEARFRFVSGEGQVVRISVDVARGSFKCTCERCTDDFTILFPPDVESLDLALGICCESMVGHAEHHIGPVKQALKVAV